MLKLNSISHNDWEKISAETKASYDVTLNLYTMLAISLGKSHPATKRALTVHNKAACLQSDMHHLALENAREVLGAKEIDILFPNTYILKI